MSRYVSLSDLAYENAPTLMMCEKPRWLMSIAGACAAFNDPILMNDHSPPSLFTRSCPSQTAVSSQYRHRDRFVFTSAPTLDGPIFKAELFSFTVYLLHVLRVHRVLFTTISCEVRTAHEPTNSPSREQRQRGAG
jgi:hypothetical protein